MSAIRGQTGYKRKSLLRRRAYKPARRTSAGSRPFARAEKAASSAPEKLENTKVEQISIQQ